MCLGPSQVSVLVRQLGVLWALTRYYVRLIPGHWYRQPPFLPLPPAAYVRWRLRTAYGSHRPAWPEVLRDLWQFGEWLRTFNRRKSNASSKTLFRRHDPPGEPGPGDSPARRR